MPTYRNGFIPSELLVTFKTGWNATDGNWHHSLSPATYARHKALVARALKRTGRVLAISLGWSAYRPYDAQVLARKIWGSGAASPGTSSHGGYWEGRQTLAVDYGNWSWVYENHGGYPVFADDCRAVGLTPGMIMRSRGYPDEPWHVIDLNPWSAVPADLESEDFGGFLMALTDEQQAQMYSILVGGSQINFAKLIAKYVWEHKIAAQNPDGTFVKPPVAYTAAGYVASTNARVGGEVADVDEVELAAALAPLLVDSIGALSDEDLARVAQAVNDDQDRRERKRLEVI